MGFPIKTCSICGEEFELKPGKPGFANRCPDCTDIGQEGKGSAQGPGHGADAELNSARRQAMRDLLYRKDS